MRDFRDAKVMAQSLRAELALKGHPISVGESLEMMAHALGVADWNTLSAQINNAPKLPPAAAAYRRGEWPVGRRPPLVELSVQSEEVLNRAVEMAKQRGHWGQFSAEHVLLALTADPDALDMMQACGADVDLVGADLGHYLDGLTRRTLDEVPPEQTNWNLGFITLPAVAMAAMGGRSEANGADMLDSVRHQGGRAAQILSARGFDRMRAHNYWTARSMEPRLPVALDDAHTWAALMWGNYNYDQNLRQSDRLRKTLRAAVEAAMQRQHQAVTSTHLLLALTDDPDAVGLMRACGVEPERLKLDLVTLLTGEPESGDAGRAKPWLEAMVKPAFAVAKAMKHRRLTGAHMLLALMSELNDRAGQLLRDRGADREQGLRHLESPGRP